jgi:hypothetical protein
VTCLELVQVCLRSVCALATFHTPNQNQNSKKKKKKTVFLHGKTCRSVLPTSGQGESQTYLSRYEGHFTVRNGNNLSSPLRDPNVHSGKKPSAHPRTFCQGPDHPNHPLRPLRASVVEGTESRNPRQGYYVMGTCGGILHGIVTGQRFEG